MANTQIANLPLYTGDTTGAYLVMNNSGQTTTYKVIKETLIGVSGTSGTSGSSGSNGSSGTSGTTYSVYGSGMSVFSTNALGSTTILSGSPLSVSTTPSYLNAGNTFSNAGGTDTWNIMDTSNSIAWRVSCIIGGSYNNNLITIERLY